MHTRTHARTHTHTSRCSLQLHEHPSPNTIVQDNITFQLECSWIADRSSLSRKIIILPKHLTHTWAYKLSLTKRCSCCRQIDCEQIRSRINQQLIAGHFGHEGLCGWNVLPTLKNIAMSLIIHCCCLVTKGKKRGWWLSGVTDTNVFPILLFFQQPGPLCSSHNTEHTWWN